MIAEGQRLLVGLHPQAAALLEQAPSRLHLDDDLDARKRLQPGAEQAVLGTEVHRNGKLPPHHRQPFEQILRRSRDQKVVPAGRRSGPMASPAQQGTVKNNRIIGHGAKLVGTSRWFNAREVPRRWCCRPDATAAAGLASPRPTAPTRKAGKAPQFASAAAPPSSSSRQRITAPIPPPNGKPA